MGRAKSHAFMRAAGLVAAGWLLVACGQAAPNNSAELPPPSPTATNTAQVAAPTAPPPPTATPVDVAPTPVPPSPTPTLPTATPIPALTEQIAIGRTASGDDIMAERIGLGPLRIVLAADSTTAGAELSRVANNLKENIAALPPTVTLWIVPDLNPAGVPGMLTDADTGFDGCYENDGGERFAFTSPEARALRDLTASASAVLLFTDSAESAAVFEDTCRRYPPTRALGAAAGSVLGLPQRGLRDAPGHFVDYLAAQGTAAVAITGQHAAEQLLALIDVLQGEVPAIASADTVAAGATTTWLTADTVSAWRYDAGAFVHPIALEVMDETAYLLDGGRILQLDLSAPTPPQRLIATGAEVDGWRVQELIDIAVSDDALFALDRAGDVYRYAVSAETWTLDRFDRDVRDISAHYYVALAADETSRTLAETSYKFALNYDAEGERLWTLPDGREIDVAVANGTTTVLLSEMETPQGDLRAYRDTATVDAFDIEFAPFRPRALSVSGESATVLDQAGRRLLRYDSTDGRLVERMQFTDGTRVSALWRDGDRVLLAGRDTVYFINDLRGDARISGGDVLAGAQPHDWATWADNQAKIIPLGIRLAERDFQMPGAPRHYRLGIHAGFDLYFAAGTQVQAAADGVVMRADHDYVEPDPTAFSAWRGQSFSLGYTSSDAQDFYRGRQVWVQHDDGTIGRYVHLSSIDPLVVEGARVSLGQIIARVGNSGSPASVDSETEDAHLHFELWAGDYYLGQYIRPIETREWGRQILR